MYIMRIGQCFEKVSRQILDARHIQKASEQKLMAQIHRACVLEFGA